MTAVSPLYGMCELLVRDIDHTHTNRLPVVRGFARCRERFTFLCLCKEKMNKRKHTPSTAPGAQRRVRVLRGVSGQHIPVLSGNVRPPVARPLGLIRESRRDRRGPAGQERRRIVFMPGQLATLFQS